MLEDFFFAFVGVGSFLETEKPGFPHSEQNLTLVATSKPQFEH
jgi:hypothetical protein